MLEIEDLISKKLVEIWDEFSENEFAQIPPLSVSEIPCNSIIFIGLNPSLSENERIRLIENDVKIEFYKHNFHKENNHKYFHKFIDIAAQTNHTWGHFDLLYIRETKQNNVLKLIADKQGLDFIYKQLILSKSILEKIIVETNPKLFIVNNTLSRKFLGKDKIDNKNVWLDLDFIWDKKIGTYRYKNIPFYFTSMLTGQRALDLGSYERLIWQIKLITEK
jgi:hypothetical protein